MVKKSGFAIIALSLLMGFNNACLATEQPGHKDKFEAFIKEEDFDSALKEAESMIKEAPSDSDGHRLRGDAFLMLSRLDDAIKAYDKAIELNPSNQKAFSGRAGARLARDEFELSLADFDKTVELSPKDGVLYNNRAALHFQLAGDSLKKRNEKEARKQVDEGLQDAGQAIKLGYDFIIVRLQLAAGHWIKARVLEDAKAQRDDINKEYIEAVNEFTAAIDAPAPENVTVAEANKHMVSAKLGVVQSYYLARDYENSIKSVDKYIDGMPRRDKANAYFLRLLSNRQLGRLQEAEKDMAKYMAAKKVAK